ncbi:Hypothetical predicted protein [Lecanosticta acicola]|uniref:Uncharacterized protein n=1 Tax=Lecanosticta acicola TaxID=111012 RepID=A0AAI8Z1S0_9PEZI|nr:Hypothetical predicted protein [Lecanosticta acicola]
MEGYNGATRQKWQVPTSRSDKNDLPTGVPLPYSATETNPPTSAQEPQPSMGKRDGSVNSTSGAHGPAACLHEDLRVLGLRGRRAVAARRPPGRVELERQRAERERAERERAENEIPELELELNGKAGGKAAGEVVESG